MHNDVENIIETTIKKVLANFDGQPVNNPEWSRFTVLIKPSNIDETGRFVIPSGYLMEISSYTGQTVSHRFSYDDIVYASDLELLFSRIIQNAISK